MLFFCLISLNLMIAIRVNKLMMTLMMVTVSLVVEHNVGSPDLVRWNSNELDPIKLCWHPSQLVVIPDLTEKKRKNTESMLWTQPSVFCFALYTADSISHWRHSPSWEYFWNTYLYCRQNFLWCFTVEPNKDNVANNLMFIDRSISFTEHLRAFNGISQKIEQMCIFFCSSSWK